MSDDAQPPPLRLKPRLKPEDAPAAGEPLANARKEPETQPQETKEESLAEDSKLRLKNDSGSASASPASPGRSTEDKLRLRFPSSDTSSGPPIDLASLNITPPKGTPPLFLPSTAPEPEPKPSTISKGPQPPVLGPKKSEASAPGATTSAPVSPVQRKGFKIGVGICAGILVLFLAVCGFLAWSWLSGERGTPDAGQVRAANETIKPAATAQTSTPAKAPSLAAPIERTQKTLAERKEGDAVKAGDLGATPAPASAQAPVGQEPAKTVASSETKTEQTAATPVPGIPSEAFKRYVAGLNIRGVFQGSPARILIDRRTVQQGEWADRQLGIRFESIDATLKTATFREVATDTTITRKY